MKYFKQFSKNAVDDSVRVLWTLIGTVDGETVTSEKESILSDAELTAMAVADGRTVWDERDIFAKLGIDGNHPDYITAFTKQDPEE